MTAGDRCQRPGTLVSRSDGPGTHMSTTGLQVEMMVEQPGGCPAASVSAETGETVGSISWSAPTGDDGQVTEEFTLDADAEVSDDGVRPVFETGASSRYRFTRTQDNCVCAEIESQACPVEDVHARDGTLYITFYAPDVETVRTIVTDLRETFDGVQLRHLSRSGSGTLNGEQLAVVDCNKLTDRQQEVVETAYEMGYFEHPKETNATEVAEALDISLSTFTEHLAVAQSKILAAVVDEE
jgi:predicted DNA binding protein